MATQGGKLSRENDLANNEKTSKEIGKIASRGLRDPGSLTKGEIKKVSGAALTQRPDHKPAPKGKGR